VKIFPTNSCAAFCGRIIGHLGLRLGKQAPPDQSDSGVIGLDRLSASWILRFAATREGRRLSQAGPRAARSRFAFRGQPGLLGSACDPAGYVLSLPLNSGDRDQAGTVVQLVLYH